MDIKNELLKIGFKEKIYEDQINSFGVFLNKEFPYKLFMEDSFNSQLLFDKIQFENENVIIELVPKESNINGNLKKEIECLQIVYPEGCPVWNETEILLESERGKEILKIIGVPENKINNDYTNSPNDVLLEAEKIRLPSYWACALINEDFSGYNEKEKEKIIEWQNKNNDIIITGFNENSILTFDSDFGISTMEFFIEKRKNAKRKRGLK